MTNLSDTDKPEAGGLMICNLCLMPSIFTGKVSAFGVYETVKPSEEEWFAILSSEAVTDAAVSIVLQREGWDT